MNIGIVGCGKMADQHAEQILNIADSDLVAVCDQEILLAKDLSERYKIGKYFSSISDMFRSVKLDVVHITTPPQSHYSLAKTCLENGCHVYVEKPFTIDTFEAQELINIAKARELKITAGHNAQFTPTMIRMRELVNSGYLGGMPIHIESHYCYDFGDESYAKALLGDKNHWIRVLPGSLLQNIISHGISKVAEFLSEKNLRIMACGYTSTFLEKIGEHRIIDELRVILIDENSTSAYFTFSSQIKPVPHQLKLYGKKNSLLIDEDNQTIIKIEDFNYKSYLKYFIPPFKYAKQYLDNLKRNFIGFIKMDFHLPNNSGLRKLIELFYKSITHNYALPLTYREILLTSMVMDEIFRQINKKDN